MAHPYYHAVISARKFGGTPEDYIQVHNWFDASKEMMGDFRHRALRHHAQGIYECERTFGVTITNSDNKQVPTRLVGEQHVVDDCGRIPSLQDWFSRIQPEPWMNSPRKISKELNRETTQPEESI